MLMNLSLSLSLFIIVFCVLSVLLRDCLARKKGVDGGSCHRHISYLVQPKTRFFRQTTTRKKKLKNLANTFSDAIAILKKKLPADARKYFS